MTNRAHIAFRLRRILLSVPFVIVAGLVLVYALAGFFLAPYLIKREIPRFAEEKLKARAAVAEARVNPFLLTLELKGFELAEGGSEPMFEFERLFVDLEASGLFRWAWTFNEIVLERPGIALDIDPNGQLNLARLIDRLRAADAKPNPEEKGGLPRMLIRRAAIERGAVSMTDRSDATPAQATVDPIDFELRDISTLPEQGGDYTLNARLPAGATLSWRGTLSLQPIASTGEVAIRDLKLSTVWNFLRDELLVEEPGGALSLGWRYDMSYGGGALQAAASGLTLRAKDLSITPRGEEAPILALSEIDVPDGTIDLAKRSVQFPAFRVRGGRLAFSADEGGVTNWQKIFIDDEGGARPVKKSAQANPDPWRVSVGDVRVADIALRYSDGSRLRPLLVEADSTALTLGMSVEAGSAVKLVLEKIGVELGNPRIGSIDGETAIAFDKVSLSGGKLDLASRSAVMEAIELTGGATRLVREKDGALPIADLFAPKAPKPEEGEPFDFSIARIAVSGHALGVSDNGTEPAIAYELTDASLTLENIASRTDAALKFDVSANVRQGGTLRAAGSFDRVRTRVEGKLDVSKLPLKPLEPLLAQHTVLKLAAGHASASGRIVWSGDRPGAGERYIAGVRYVGTASVEELVLNDPGGERFLSWKSLVGSRVTIDPRRNRYTIEDVHLVEPGGKIVINKDRSLSVGDVLRKPEGPAASAEPRPSAAVSAGAPAAEGEPRFTVVVSRVRVEKGNLDFADLSLVLPFSTQIRELNGAITGLSSDEGSRAGVKLEGQVEDYGLARIDGTINPFRPKAHTDLTVIFRNVHMTPFSPYSATFAGRKIASGRLSLDLQYKLNDSQLEGENKILLEQFTLGERVESASAVNLPLDLAIAILTDANGRIDIAVPVSGNVDQPEFSYGHLVWQAIRTLITRVVTAPFRALASAFGGGAETLEEIAFDAGSARLLPPEREKLANLAETLAKRPQLKLVVQGRYHQARDGAALRETALRRDIAAKLEIKLAPNEDPGPVPFDRARTQRVLEALLAARTGQDEAAAQFAAAFGKEKGREVTRVNPVLAVIGRASADRELYEAMYRRLIELQSLPDATLQDLARQRAGAILKELAERSGLGPERLGQKDPEATGDAISAKLSLDVARKAEAPSAPANAGS